MQIHYQSHLKELAQKLRNNCTYTEAILWQHLKGKQMRGYDFHRQKPIDWFIVDFYCFRLKLAIELDGTSHDSKDAIEKDILRENRIKDLGIKIIRFRNEEVEKELPSVIARIEKYIEEFEKGGGMPTHPPAPSL